MTSKLFVSIIINLCGGDGKGNINMSCFDYYNNCVINKSVTISEKNINECKKELTLKGIKYKLD